ncbi:CGNR zinc finger domain-containing protein [Pelagibius sp. Alg239-R121]|uniref:CGNR zinc finger domain-containing protein n=1 Tax=Pelagibius sp. Alg239-R121 TaxID=2993448 RepID=UPI0024A692F3|nr:CGNR zinc finger domain-containing protein [Pelagibius sp. Alg239-R121]
MDKHFWTKFGFFGGHAGLDFINTIDDVEKTRALSGIPDWATVLDWALAAKILSCEEAKLLARQDDDAAAQGELAKLHRFRESAWCVLSSVAAKQTPDEEETAALSREIRWAIAQSFLDLNEGSFRWSVREAEFGLKLVRARLALAVSDLISLQDLQRLKECGRCTGLFLDHGRGRGRRWCRMNTCGNRTKTERFRAGPTKNS